MKITKMLKLADEFWIKKPGGFRVRFQKREKGEWVTDYMPSLEDAPLDSDVVAWRSAWKMFQSSRPGEGELVNLTVVDDKDNPIRYYATGGFDVYNPREGIVAEPLPDTPLKEAPEIPETVSEEQVEIDARGSEAQPSSEESDK